MKSNKEFYCGFAAAVAAVTRRGLGGVAVDAMDSNGIALSDLIAAGVEEFDLEPIREEYKLQGRNHDGHDRKRALVPMDAKETEVRP